MVPWWKIICRRPISPAHGNMMKKINAGILATVSLAVVSSVASAQTSVSQTTLVTVENYNRAQTDVNFAGVVKNGGFGKFRHGRELAPPAQQGIVRPNRDTLYSFAIVDLDAGLGGGYDLILAAGNPGAMRHFEAFLPIGNFRYGECSSIDLKNIAGGVALNYNA